MKRYTLDDVMELLRQDARTAELYTNWQPELTRTEIAGRLGCSYSTANRLVTKGVSQGKLKLRWDHQHQSYWEGWFAKA